MIRLLINDDYDMVETFMNKDHIHNLYPIHALQTHGLDTNEARFWGAFQGKQLEGILCAQKADGVRFGCMAGNRDKTLARLGRFAHKSGIRLLVGKQEYILPALEALRPWVIQKRIYEFYEIHPEELKGRYDHPVKKAGWDAIPLLVEHYDKSDYGFINSSREEIEAEVRRAMEFESGYFFIERHHKAVAAARIIAETDQAGIIDASSTLPEYRGQGMNPCVRTACFEYLFQKGKIGAGYIRDSNVAMHKIINRYGGTVIAKWYILTLKGKPSLRQRIHGILSPLRCWLQVQET